MTEENTLGRTLRQAREARKLTLSSVAATTRIPMTVLEALEGDAMADLPADVYVRGFVRAYCRVVGLPEAPPLEQLDRALVQRRNTAAGLTGTPEEIGRPLMPVTPIGALGRRRIKVIGAVAAVVLLVIIFVLMR